MTVNQIYNVVNNLNEMSTTGISEIVNHTGFVAFGEALSSSDNLKEVVYNKLFDMVGKVVIAIDEYKKKGRNISVDSFEFGALLSKISYNLQDASEDSDWKLPSGNNPYTVQPKNGIVNKIFKRPFGVFEFEDVALKRQLESAFHNESELGGFIEGLYTRMRNAREISIENLENATIGALAMETYVATTNAVRQVRHLLTEYKAIHTDSTLTSTTCKTDYGFLQYVVTEMYNTLPFLERYTSMYNDGTVERVTTRDDLVVEMVSQFSNYIDMYLKSNTYHDNLIHLPNYAEVPYWESPSDPYTITHGESDEDNETLENLVAIFRDKDACACTHEYERTVSKYDEWNDRVPFKMTAERSYMVDTSENCIIWLLD